MWADNTCDFCAEGLQASCRHGGQWGDEGVDGGQGEAVRVPQAQGTLVQVTGGWFPGTQVRHQGHIWAGGIDKDVTFAEAEIITEIEDRVVFVPVASIVTFAGVERVMTVHDGLSVEKRVQTGRRFGDRVEIVEGLRPEELVVVEPGNLIGGQPVTVSP